MAGSWIGGSANQAAMKEVFEVGDEVFSAMVAVDVLVASVWMAVLLFMAGEASQIDRCRSANTSALEDLKRRATEFHERHARVASTPDLITIVAVGFGVTGASDVLADLLAPWIEQSAPGLARLSLTSQFFWLVVLATIGGLLLSLTRMRELEGAGASKVASVMLYILVASIGMGMDISAVADRPGLFAVGALWMAIYAGVMLVVGRVIKAPTFYLAVGSQANVGGAASAPVVAAAFHPSPAPVGVLLAVLGYKVETFGAWLCGQLMRVAVSG